MLENGSAGGAHLLRKVAGGKTVAGDIIGVDGLHLLGGKLRRNEPLHQQNAEPLLEGTDHNEIGKVDTVVALFDRSRHGAGADIIIDGGGGDGFLLL